MSHHLLSRGSEPSDVVHDVPAVGLRDLRLERWHSGARYAFREPGEQLAVRMAGRHVDAEVGSPLPERWRQRSVSPTAKAVAGDALLLVNLAAAGNRGRIGWERVAE